MKNFKKVFISLVVCLSMLLSLAACGETKTYTVTFDSGVEAQTVDEGKTATKPTDPTKAATAEFTYTFAGWYNGETEYDFTTPVTADISLTAKFTATTNKYDVTFGGMKGIEKQNLDYGAKVTEPAAEKVAKKDGYKFLGWYNGNDKFDFAADTVEGDLDLKPKYENISTAVEIQDKDEITINSRYTDVAVVTKNTTDVGFEGATKVMGGATEYRQYNGLVLLDGTDNSALAEANFMTFDFYFVGTEELITTDEWDPDNETYVQVMAEIGFVSFGISTYSGAGEFGEDIELGADPYGNDPSEMKTKILDANGALVVPAESKSSIELGYNKWYTAVVPLDAESRESAWALTFDSYYGDESKERVVYIKNLTACMADPAEPVFDGIHSKVTFCVGTTTTNEVAVIGEAITKPADPTNSIGTFDAWYKEGESTAFDFTTPITGDITLVAKFTYANTVDVVPFVPDYSYTSATLEECTETDFTDSLKYSINEDPDNYNDIVFVDDEHPDLINAGYKYVSVKVYLTADCKVTIKNEVGNEYYDKNIGTRVYGQDVNTENSYYFTVYDEDGNVVNFDPPAIENPETGESTPAESGLELNKWYTFVIPFNYDEGYQADEYDSFAIRFDPHWNVTIDSENAFSAYVKAGKAWLTEPTAQDLGFTVTEPQA